jgi:hypothetical protein
MRLFISWPLFRLLPQIQSLSYPAAGLYAIYQQYVGKTQNFSYTKKNSQLSEISGSHRYEHEHGCMAVSRNVAMCSLVDTDECFRGACCLRVMEAGITSEMSVSINQTTRRNTQKTAALISHLDL